MEIIKLNSQLDKFYKPWAKVESFLLPDGKHFVSSDLLGVDYLQGIEDDINAVKDSETELHDLPGLGELCTEDVIYKFTEGEDESLVICRQTHTRTIHPPSDIPALFTFFRENSDDLEWIPNELVETGWKRVYEGTTYEVIQGHMTQSDWTPDVTPTLWQAEEIPGAEYPVWVQPTGAHDIYTLGEIVWYPTEGSTLYITTHPANSWPPGVYGWEVYTP